MRYVIPAGIVVAALAMSCTHTGPIQIRSGVPITAEGEIQSGAECPMLRVGPELAYALGGDLQGFKVGDHVCVRGRLAEVSYCMAGKGTIAVEAIGPAGDCP